MSFEIVTIPCLEDNYAFLLINNGGAVLIDVPEAAPILAEVQKRDVWVHSVWLTHHHDDHVQGLDAFLDTHPAGEDVSIYGAEADRHRLPACEFYLKDGDTFKVCGEHDAVVLDVSGHTLGHIAYYVPDATAAFTGDSLMALGCGRLFEGAPEQMWESLSKLAKLPPETMIYSGHEYVAGNAAFALTIEPKNAALNARALECAARRKAGGFNVPSRLSEELATNPFLRAGLEDVKTLLDMRKENDVEVFAEIRRRKDLF